MARSIKVVENKTHWRSSDIGRMVRLCLKAAAPSSIKTEVVIVSADSSSFEVSKEIAGTYNFDTNPVSVTQRRILTISLPRRGKRSNQSPLIQLAQAALGGGGDILPLHQTYDLAVKIAKEVFPSHKGQRGWHSRRNKVYKVPRGTRPTWIPDDFSIRKYAPQKKRVDTRAFTEKVEDDIACDVHDQVTSSVTRAARSFLRTRWTFTLAVVTDSPRMRAISAYGISWSTRRRNAARSISGKV